MSDHPRPARALVRLLERVSSSHGARAAVGDILEELHERISARRRPRWGTLWLHAQMGVAVIASLRVAAPRWRRACGHTLRDAARALRRSPAHAFFILGVLAVAIAAATVTFSVVDAVVLRPLPFDRSDQLVQIAAAICAVRFRCAPHSSGRSMTGFRHSSTSALCHETLTKSRSSSTPGPSS